MNDELEGVNIPESVEVDGQTVIVDYGLDSHEERHGEILVVTGGSVGYTKQGETFPDIPEPFLMLEVSGPAGPYPFVLAMPFGMMPAFGRLITESFERFADHLGWTAKESGVVEAEVVDDQEED